MKKIKFLFLISIASILAGCASSPKTPVSSKIITWNINNSPLLSEIISTPIESIENTYAKEFKIIHQKGIKTKFESEDEYKKRISAEPTVKKYFVVKPLITNNCTSYDFSTKTYKIACDGFLGSEALITNWKTMGSVTLSNAYTSREVEISRAYKFYISADIKAKAELALSAEEAKEIDNDLMVGLVYGVGDVTIDFRGCSKSDVTFLDDKICKEISFNSGVAAQSYEQVTIPNTFYNFVIFRKSNNRVLSNAIYTASEN